jgi:predicted transcriptional regulator
MNIPLRVALKNIYKLQNSNNNNNNDEENNNTHDENSDHTIEDDEPYQQEIKPLHDVTLKDQENLINEVKYRAYYIMSQLNPSLRPAKPDTEVLSNLQILITQNKYYNKLMSTQNKTNHEFNIKKQDVITLQHYLDQQLLTTNELYNTINAMLPQHTIKISLIKLLTRNDITPTSYEQISLIENISKIDNNLQQIKYTDEQLEKIVTLYYDKNKDLKALNEIYVFDFLDIGKIQEVVQVIDEYDSEVSSFHFKVSKDIVCGAGLEYEFNNNNNNNNNNSLSNEDNVIVTFSKENKSNKKSGAMNDRREVLREVRITDKMWKNLISVSKHMQGLVVDVNQGENLA